MLLEMQIDLCCFNKNTLSDRIRPMSSLLISKKLSNKKPQEKNLFFLQEKSLAFILFLLFPYSPGLLAKAKGKKRGMGESEGH